MAERDVPVLIVGASLVGMSTALLLAHHGVRPLAVERHTGTAIHPRAAQISQRTMEIFRTVGIEPIVRTKSDDQFVQDGAIMAVETLAGKELAWFIPNLNEGVRDVSPTERVFISQSLLEPLLKTRAEQLGAELLFNTDMIAFEEHGDGVRARVRDRSSGRTETVRCRYLIATDGAHSKIRDTLGIATSGHGVFSNSVTIYFRANVAPLIRNRNLSVIYVNNPELRGFFRFEKPYDSGFLAINALGDPGNPVTDVAKGLTEQECVRHIHTALGSEDVEVEIESVMPWKAAAEVADRLREGRVFLAGDAAHVMPPNGGFGGNTGVQDAHNLAWKLAAVLDGTAEAGLLDTYEPERLPVGTFTTEQAYSRYVTRTAPYLGTDGIQEVENDLDVELGYGYVSRAIIPDSPVPLHENPRESKGRPGTRAPHFWLDRGGERISTLDLYGRRFVLMIASDGSRWDESARDAMPAALDVHRIGQNRVTDRDGTFGDAHGLEPDGALLVRPDGFVGWRARSGENASPDTIRQALRTLLCT